MAMQWKRTTCCAMTDSVCAMYRDISAYRRLAVEGDHESIFNVSSNGSRAPPRGKASFDNRICLTGALIRARDVQSQRIHRGDILFLFFFWFWCVFCFVLLFCFLFL